VARRTRRRGPRCREAPGLLDHGAELGHVVHGDDHFDLEGLADTGIDHRDAPWAPHAVLADRRAAEEAGDLLQGPLRGGQADPLRRRATTLANPVVEPLEGDRQVAAALGGSEGMDLIDDHGLDPVQRLPGGRREHEVQRLRRGDEDVGRVPDEVPSLVGRRVTGADADGRLRVHLIEPLRRQPDALERAPEVLLDVDRQRTQRR
jgi:hypothetical protein